MDAGVSGLNSHGKALSVVADNIANVSTMGFKSSRANFGDIMVRSLTVGGSVVDQVGVGSRILNVQQMMLQGSFESTEVPTDLAISGSGFFKVRDPVTMSTFTGQAQYDVNGKPLNMNTGASYYTRAGQFIVDPEGYLVNPMGLRLQGYNVDIRGNLNLFPEDLRLLTQQVDAIRTTEVDLTLNLNAEDERYHAPSQPVDPTDSNSYNHMSSVRTYDTLGVAHDLVVFYQRLTPDSYTGPQIAGTTRVWKAVVMEKVGDTYTQSNFSPGYTGTFYLHFDDYGHLTGNTTGLPAAGDAYKTTKALPTLGNELSNRAGETFTYNTDVNNASGANLTFRTSLTIDLANWSAGDIISINGVAYAYDATTMNSAAQLAAAINLTAANNGVFCKVDASGNLVLSTSGNTTAGVNFTNGPAPGDLSATGVSSSDFISAVNAGGGTGSALTKARGALVLPSGTTTGGGTINFTTSTGTIIPVTLPAGPVTAAALAAYLNADPGLVGNYAFTAYGDTVYIEAIPDGANSNAKIDISAGAGLIGTPNVEGGYTPATNIQISQDAQGVFQFQRMDQGATAVLNVDPGNTIANGGFTMQKSSFAMDMEVPFSTNADETGPARKGVRMMSFGWLGEDGSHEPQEIMLDYIPNINSPTTQSAGSSDNFYIYQDGAPRGTLESIDIGKDGLISGNFSNGTVKLLGSVILFNVSTPEKLKREGENLWSVTLASGPEIWGRPGQGNLGKVQSGALEKSNVDLATEMVNMINFQRAFQANSKTIQTTDQLLQELIQLKR
jgi:flagellar hook protein FlgE